MDNLFVQIRKACRDVAAKASWVHIDYDRIPAYAAALPVPPATSTELDPKCHYLGHEEKTVAFLLTLDTHDSSKESGESIVIRPGGILSRFNLLSMSLSCSAWSTSLR